MRNQRGISGIGALFVIAVICITALLSIKLVPVYLEHYSVAESLEQLKTAKPNASMHGMRKKFMFIQMLQRRLDINDVRRVKQKNITVVREKKGYKISVAYQAHVKIIANVSALIDFSDSVLVESNGQR